MIGTRSLVRRRRARRQRGAVAIEFAIVFPLFLLIFYAIVSYSLLFVYQQGLHTLSADAVRQAVSVARDDDGALDAPAIAAAVGDYVNDEAAPWPARLASLCEGGGVSVDVDEAAVRVCVEATLALPRIDFTPLGIELTIPGFTTVDATSSLRL